MRRRNGSDTRAGSRSARDTVIGLTPARVATSAIVVRPFLRLDILPPPDQRRIAPLSIRKGQIASSLTIPVPRTAAMAGPWRGNGWTGQGLESYARETNVLHPRPHTGHDGERTGSATPPNRAQKG